jgi:predicted membrane-bound mannosyltransferase
MSKRHALWFMTAVLLTAALLRLPALEQFPPGLHYDEAANRILAGDIGLRGERPIFISSYTGKETLFFYLAGGLMRLLGEHTFALRLTSAFVGLLTVAVTYALGREITRHSRLVPLVAAGLLATSFWHLLFSRLGFRVITQPLLQAITLWLLWRGVRCGWMGGGRGGFLRPLASPLGWRGTPIWPCGCSRCCWCWRPCPLRPAGGNCGGRSPSPSPSPCSF